jgi:predicted CXXCH cytochrome family protein
MKKSATKTLLLVMIAIVSVLMVAQIAKAASDIASTKHNLKVTGGLGHDGEICVYCHTPHGAQSGAATTAAGSVPLWNRATNATTSYQIYAGPGTLNASVGQPGGVSLACLSCHDGSTAIDAYGGQTATRRTAISGNVSATGLITGSPLIGTDLRNDHPIGFAYNAALVTADGGLKAPDSLVGVKLFGADTKMECASCHSVHDDTFKPFLRVSNTTSGLCLACHNK